MTNNDIYKYLLGKLRKSTKGNALAPETFTSYLQQANLELFNKEFQKFEATQRISDSFRPFKTSTTLSVTAGSAALPTAAGSEYFHIIPILYYGSVKVDFATLEEYLDRKSDELTQATTTHPIAYIADSSNIEFDGVTSGSVTMYYLKKPSTPYFDYYIDDDYQVQYLSASEDYTLQGGEVYRDGTESGEVSSLSVELDWADNDKIKIANIILGYLGVQLEDQSAYQDSALQEQQDDILR